MSARPANGPEFWDVILRDIRRENPSIQPIIAGGAVRDFILGGEAKDIDVWFYKSTRGGPTTATMHKAKRWTRVVPDDEDENEYASNSRLKMLHNYAFYGWDVQLIGVDVFPWGWESLVNDFNIGLSKMAYDGAVHAHADALTDIANKTVSIVKPNAGERLKRCVGKATALAAKYGFDKSNIIPAAMSVVDDFELEEVPF